VRETLSLPRLTALDDTPPWVLGAFDLRGELTPVVSIEVCLGAPTPTAAVSDLVIVADIGGHPVALHARGLHSLCRALRTAVHPADQDPAPARRPGWQIPLSEGAAPVVTESCLRVGAHEVLDNRATAEARLAAFERRLDAAAVETLDERAHRFGELGADRRRRPRWPFIQVLIDGERFAFAASSAVTFADIESTPRGMGEATGLVDVRRALGIPGSAGWQPHQAVLMDVPGDRRAIAVDAVEHFVHARPDDASSLSPVAIAARVQWITGAIQGEDRLLPVIDPMELLLGETAPPPDAER
jgi:chemotaxis signal transduction protein